jgi:hypothetical protein
MDITSIPVDKLKEFEKAQKEYATLLGSRGGQKTSSNHTKEWYQNNQKKSVEARNAKKLGLDTASK